jgi:hypothetical protein
LKIFWYFLKQEVKKKFFIIVEAVLQGATNNQLTGKNKFAYIIKCWVGIIIFYTAINTR